MFLRIKHRIQQLNRGIWDFFLQGMYVCACSLLFFKRSGLLNLTPPKVDAEEKKLHPHTSIYKNLGNAQDRGADTSA